MRAKRVGYYERREEVQFERSEDVFCVRSKEVYFERSDEGNASEASNLIKRAQRGCVLMSEARKCIASEASRVLFRAKQGGYCELDISLT